MQQVWAGTVQQGSSSREYIITNKDYDAVQHTGDTLSFSLVARTSGDSNPSIEATIEGCGGGSGSSGSGGNTQTQWTVAPSSGDILFSWNWLLSEKKLLSTINCQSYLGDNECCLTKHYSYYNRTKCLIALPSATAGIYNI